jgi:hypothetical protein
MTVQSRDPSADPLYARPLPERPSYATGMMLAAQDFSDEQTYHRGRLARALAQLSGNGTLAGLRVHYEPEVTGGDAPHPEEIVVDPGVAVDRLGRLIEVPRPACLRLVPWFTQQAGVQGGDAMRLGSYDNLGRFSSVRRQADATPLPGAAVVADVYLRFIACAHGYTPSFATGPYDALDAVSVSRLRDAYEVVMALRAGLSNTNSGLPLPGVDLSGQSPADRRAATQDAVLAAYPATGRSGSTDPLDPLPEHPLVFDHSAVFLARLFIPVQALVATGAPLRSADAPQVDNFGRRFLPAVNLLANAIGL